MAEHGADPRSAPASAAHRRRRRAALDGCSPSCASPSSWSWWTTRSSTWRCRRSTATWGRPSPRCSGSSTPTAWPSPACCWPAAGSGTGWGARAPCRSGSSSSDCSRWPPRRAHSTGTLIAARALMGVAAAFIFPASLAILTSIFPDPSERQKALGIWGATSGIAVAFGPIVGGRAARALLVRVDLPRQRAHRGRHVDRRPDADPAPAPGRRQHPFDVRGVRRLDGGGDGAGAGHHRGAAMGMGGPRRRWRASPRRPSC